MDEPRREALEMIIRESLRMRSLAVAAGLEEVALMIERTVHEAHSELLAAGHEPRPEPPLGPKVIDLDSHRKR